MTASDLSPASKSDIADNVASYGRPDNAPPPQRSHPSHSPSHSLSVGSPNVVTLPPQAPTTTTNQHRAPAPLSQIPTSSEVPAQNRAAPTPTQTISPGPSNDIREAFHRLYHSRTSNIPISASTHSPEPPLQLPHLDHSGNEITGPSTGPDTPVSIPNSPRIPTAPVIIVPATPRPPHSAAPTAELRRNTSRMSATQMTPSISNREQIPPANTPYSLDAPGCSTQYRSLL